MNPVPGDKKKTIRYRKSRKPDDVKVRWGADGTHVSAQDGSFIIFDHGDFESLVKPHSPFIICNLSGDGKLHVRVNGSREPGKAKNNIQISHLIKGLAPGDGREVRFHNGNARDMRKENLFFVGTSTKQTDEGEGGSGAPLQV